MNTLPARRALLLVLGVAAVALSACGSKDDDRIADLEGRVDRLEAAAKVSASASPTPVGKTTTYKEFGFSLPVPEGVEVKSAGLGTAKASKDEGQLTMSAGGVTMALIWTKQTIAPKDAVQGALQVLVSAQPALTFRPLSEGDMKVDNRTAAYGAFGAYDKQQALSSVGVIGAWSCGGGTFSITVVGANQAAVESSYTGFTDGFRCA
ncbi:MAG: hypothetical protein EPO16_10325 [Dehalococcoidia bacterium]|nr:MAG: hypothetical protein EPO16_10325 [Dehalococcoidia bacterium]